MNHVKLARAAAGSFLAALGLLCVVAAGCKGGSGADTKVGKLSIDLRTRGGDGATYRLRDAIFEITEQGSDEPLETIASEDLDPEAEAIHVELLEGQYEVALSGEWWMERAEDDELEEVTASLLSPAEVDFEIESEATTQVVYTFAIVGSLGEADAGPDPEPEPGDLEIGIDVVLDADGDSVADEDDNCPLDANEDQTDADTDGIGDACENASHTPGVARAIDLEGAIFRVVYDREAHIAYGLDAVNRRLSRIDLNTDRVEYHDVVQVPNDACLDAGRGSLFVVHKGSSFITEYDLPDFSVVREIEWPLTDWGASTTHFHLYCAPDRLYAIDGAWDPRLYTVDGLGMDEPVVTSRSVAGVGALVVNAAATDFYYWYQYGWNAGTLNTSVRRIAADSFMLRDETSATTSQGFTRDPLDAPILLDETRGLVFAKNHIFDAENLTRVEYTLPGAVDTFYGAQENAFALDAQRGLLATRNHVYELDRYSVVADTLADDAEQMFFDRDGLLWYLQLSLGALESQAITP